MGSPALQGKGRESRNRLGGGDSDSRVGRSTTWARPPRLRWVTSGPREPQFPQLNLGPVLIPTPRLRACRGLCACLERDTRS